ncbi:MAG TPA: FAD-binding oxidoreductase [Jatrophihabitans sp.]|nr:FAD-binding oxidoreductase [Jatrophihabitans sp.]
MSSPNAPAELAAHVTGPVFDGADPRSATETAGFNLAVTHRPAVVVGATRSADVAAAVRYAAEARLPVAVQATGHGAVRPADGAVFVSTARMQGVHVDPRRRIARVQPGVRWRAVIDAAAPHGLAPLSGSSSGVGVVGYTLGGGVGHLARRHGFAADHVRAVDLVTADGEHSTVTAESDPELFWAIRGGKGNFGIVTALEFDLVPVPRFFGGSLLFGADDAAHVLHSFAAWAPTLPESATTSVALLRLPDLPSVPEPLRGRFTLALRFAYCGSAKDAEQLLAPMRSVARPLMGAVGPMRYRDVDRIHMDPTEPMPGVHDGGLLRAFSAEVVDALLGAAGPDVDVPLVMAEVRLLGGALGRPADVPNAVAGREGAYSLFAVAPAPPPLAHIAPEVTRSVLAALSPWTTGTTLLNFLGHAPTPEDVGSAWPTATLDRLRRVKGRLDPVNLFSTGHAIAPAALAGAR